MSGNSWTLHSSGSYATVNFGHTPTPGFDMYFSTVAGIFIGNTVTASCEVKLPTTNAVSNFILGSENPQKAQEFTPSNHGLNSSTWTTCSIQNVVAGFNGTYMLFGAVTAPYFTSNGLTAKIQSRGEILIRNVQISVGTSTTVSLAGNVSIGGDLDVSGTVKSNGVTLTSDERLKDDIADLDQSVAMDFVMGCNSKTFIRKDLNEDISKTPRRLGYTAQSMLASLPPHIHNVVVMQGEYYAVDYSRVVCLLHTVCQTQQRQIESMSARLTALEKPKTTKSKKTSD